MKSSMTMMMIVGEQWTQHLANILQKKVVKHPRNCEQEGTRGSFSEMPLQMHVTSLELSRLSQTAGHENWLQVHTMEMQRDLEGLSRQTAIQAYMHPPPVGTSPQCVHAVHPHFPTTQQPHRCLTEQMWRHIMPCQTISHHLTQILQPGSQQRWTSSSTLLLLEPLPNIQNRERTAPT